MSKTPSQVVTLHFVIYILPGIGEWKKWSPAQIGKIQKQRKNEKPNPEYSTQYKKWTLPIVAGKVMMVFCTLFQIPMKLIVFCDPDDSVTNYESVELV